MALSDQDLQKINALMSNQFALNKQDVDERLDKIDGRLDKVDGRLDKVDGRLDKVDGWLDKADDRFTRLDRMMDKINESLNKKIDGLEDRVVREMGMLKVEIITIGGDLVKLEERFDESKGAFRSLQGLVYQIHDYIHKEFTLTEDQVSKNTARIEEISERLRLRSLNQHL